MVRLIRDCGRFRQREEGLLAQYPRMEIDEIFEEEISPNLFSIIVNLSDGVVLRLECAARQ